MPYMQFCDDTEEWKIWDILRMLKIPLLQRNAKGKLEVNKAIRKDGLRPPKRCKKL